MYHTALMEKKVVAMMPWPMIMDIIAGGDWEEKEAKGRRKWRTRKMRI